MPNPVVTQLSLLLVNVMCLLATAVAIALDVKRMCYAAAAHNLLGVDSGTSLLATLVALEVLEGGTLACAIVMFPRKSARDEYPFADRPEI